MKVQQDQTHNPYDAIVALFDYPLLTAKSEIICTKDLFFFSRAPVQTAGHVCATAKAFFDLTHIPHLEF
jgi:hypothetical protein